MNDLKRFRSYNSKNNTITIESNTSDGSFPFTCTIDMNLIKSEDPVIDSPADPFMSHRRQEFYNDNKKKNRNTD